MQPFPDILPSSSQHPQRTKLLSPPVQAGPLLALQGAKVFHAGTAMKDGQVVSAGAHPVARIQHCCLALRGALFGPSRLRGTGLLDRMLRHYT